MARGGTSVPSDRLSRRAVSDTLNCSDIQLPSLVLVVVTATATQVQRAERRISGRMSAERRERGSKKNLGVIRFRSGRASQAGLIPDQDARRSFRSVHAEGYSSACPDSSLTPASTLSRC